MGHCPTRSRWRRSAESSIHLCFVAKYILFYLIYTEALQIYECCYGNTNERERHGPKFTLGNGALLDVPHKICLATRDQEKIIHTDRTQTDLRSLDLLTLLLVRYR